MCLHILGLHTENKPAPKGGAVIFLVSPVHVCSHTHLCRAPGHPILQQEHWIRKRPHMQFFLVAHDTAPDLFNKRG